MTDTFGSHIIAELSGCNSRLLDNEILIAQYMKEAAAQAEATVLDAYFHKFTPEGVSGILSLAASHFSIHTWPSKGYAAVDCYTCGDANPNQLVGILVDKLQAKYVEEIELIRGAPCVPDCDHYMMYSRASQFDLSEPVAENEAQ